MKYTITREEDKKTIYFNSGMVEYVLRRGDGVEIYRSYCLPYVEEILKDIKSGIRDGFGEIITKVIHEEDI